MAPLAQESPATLFVDVRVFDGISPTLSDPSRVLVRGGVIVAVAPDSDDSGLRAEAGVTIVDGAGRTLMPGLIDAHWHAVFAAVPLGIAMTADDGYVQLLAAQQARATLLRGFTTVRDAGGPVFGLKRAIDDAVVPGPRIYPSGAMISQTGGHGDFRGLHEIPRGVCGHYSHMDQVGASAIADGVDEVLRAVREQFMRGASQIKIMAGGGVTSAYDPLDVTEYTEAEMRAAVEAAENWGTYVLVHAYTPRAVQQALKVGVRCIDHGHLLDDATAALIAEHGAWWSIQPFLDNGQPNASMSPDGIAKKAMVNDGTDTAYRLAIKHGVKTAWGTDVLFDASLAEQQGAKLAAMSRWYSPADVLRTATSVNAELLAESGLRNPYPGRLGVVADGALADLLLVDGDPLADLDLVATPGTSLVVIMKDGEIVKNTLPDGVAQIS